MMKSQVGCSCIPALLRSASPREFSTRTSEFMLGRYLEFPSQNVESLKLRRLYVVLRLQARGVPWLSWLSSTFVRSGDASCT